MAAWEPGRPSRAVSDVPVHLLSGIRPAGSDDTRQKQPPPRSASSHPCCLEQSPAIGPWAGDPGLSALSSRRGRVHVRRGQVEGSTRWTGNWKQPTRDPLSWDDNRWRVGRGWHAQRSDEPRGGLDPASVSWVATRKVEASWNIAAKAQTSSSSAKNAL